MVGVHVGVTHDVHKLTRLQPDNLHAAAAVTQGWGQVFGTAPTPQRVGAGSQHERALRLEASLIT